MAFILLQNYPPKPLKELAVMVAKEVGEEYPLLKGFMPIAQIAEAPILSFAEETASTLQKSYGFKEYQYLAHGGTAFVAKPKGSEDFIIRFCVAAYQEPRLLHERIIQPIRRLISTDTSTADGKIYGICEVMANVINFAGNYFFNLDKKHFDGLDIEGKKAVVAALRETQPLIFLEAITELNNTLLNNGLDYSDANAFNHVFTLRKNADGEVIVQANVLDGGAVRIIDRSKYEAYLQERGISSVIDQKKTGLSNIAHRLRNDTPKKSL